MGCLVFQAAAQEAEESKVEASFVANTSSIEPGSTFWLGVRFEIEDGWHIYWRNPGGAGLATAVDFDLPAGWVAGSLQWPLPIAFDQSEGIPGYGYEGSVVLAAEVAVPFDFDRSQPGKVRVEASWLACKGVCVLGSAELEASVVELPEDPVFHQWAGQLPKSSGANDLPFSLSVTGGLADGAITQWLRWNEAPHLVEWFPDPSEALEAGDVRIQTKGGLTRIDAAVKSRKGALGSINDLPYTILVDQSGKVGHLYDAKTTPHMYIIDGNGTLVYIGAIDDDPRGNKGEPAVNYVAAALDELLSGNAVTTAETKPCGCSVKYKK